MYVSQMSMASTDPDTARDVPGWNYVLDFGQHNGKQLKSVPKSYIEWIVRNKVYLGKSNLQGALKQLNFIKTSTVPLSPGSKVAHAVPKTGEVGSLTPSQSGSQYLLYVMQLQHNKWYVGITENLERRRSQHSSGKGSTWTRLHPVLCIHDVSKVTEDSKVGAESKRVAELMWQHGVNNVRGAEHCNTWPFDKSDIDRLVHYLGHHLELDYNEVRQRLESQLEQPSSEGRTVRLRRGQRSNAQHNLPPTSPCFRCGRSSHWESDCFANFHVDGTALDGDDEESDSTVELAGCSTRGRSIRATQRRQGKCRLPCRLPCALVAAGRAHFVPQNLFPAPSDASLRMLSSLLGNEGHRSGTFELRYTRCRGGLIEWAHCFIRTHCFGETGQ